MTPNNQSIKYLQERGYIAEGVEQKMRHCLNSKDLFGFIDIVGVNPSMKETLAVQATSRDNTNHRIEKIIYDCKDQAIAWLQSGNRIEVHAFGGNDIGRRVEIYLDNSQLKFRNLKFESVSKESKRPLESAIALVEAPRSSDKPLAERLPAEENLAGKEVNFA